MLYWRGPNTEKFVKIQQAMQVGGPNIEKLEPQFQQAMQVGDNEINFIKYHFCLTPMHESNYVFLF